MSAFGPRAPPPSLLPRPPPPALAAAVTLLALAAALRSGWWPQLLAWLRRAAEKAREEGRVVAAGLHPVLGIVSKSSGLVSNLQSFPQRQFEGFLDAQMDSLGEKAKSVMSDPYMPRALLRIVDEAVDALLPDAKRLVLLKTDEIIRRSRGDVDFSDSSVIVVGGRKRKPKPKPTSTASVLLSWASSAVQVAASYTPAVVVKTTTNMLDSTSRALDVYTPATVKSVSASTYTRTTDSLTRVWASASSAVRNVLPTSLITATALPSSTATADDDLADVLARFTDDGTPPTFSPSLASRIRARILYISSPCDKSFWQCLRDPYWVLFTLIGLAPYGIGTMWWLLLFLLHDKSDEFQVSNFIVGFMCSKFAGGIGLTMYGSLLYFVCATRDEPTCVRDGPRVGSEIVDGLFFFLQVLLVWSCYFVLRNTRECRAVLDERDAFLVVDMERVHEKLGSSRSRGGRLAHMFWWETLCVFLILGMAAFAFLVVELRGWKFRTTLFWLKALFGLLSLPFVVFKIPVISTLLTQVRATGYDRHGRLVLHVRTPPDEERIRKLQEFQVQLQRQKANALVTSPSPFLGPVAAAAGMDVMSPGGFLVPANAMSTTTTSPNSSHFLAGVVPGSGGDGLPAGPSALAAASASAAGGVSLAGGRRYRRQSSGGENELLANISEGEEEEEEDDTGSLANSSGSSESEGSDTLPPVRVTSTTVEVTDDFVLDGLRRRERRRV